MKDDLRGTTALFNPAIGRAAPSPADEHGNLLRLIVKLQTQIVNLASSDVALRKAVDAQRAVNEAQRVVNDELIRHVGELSLRIEELTASMGVRD